MWESLSEIFTSDNSLHIIVFLMSVIIIMVMLVKGKYLNIDTSHVKIGTDQRERSIERNILRQQTEWSYNYISGLYSTIKTRCPESNEMKIRYLLECTYDEVIKWIMFNHVSRSDMYVMVKTENIIGMISNLNLSEEFKTKEFFEWINKRTKELINRLVDIREYYSK